MHILNQIQGEKVYKGDLGDFNSLKLRPSSARSKAIINHNLTLPELHGNRFIKRI